MSETKKNIENESGELKDELLEEASGGAETVHLYLKSNAEDIQGESTQALVSSSDTLQKVKREKQEL